MDEKDLKALLKSGGEKLGVDISEDSLSKFIIYLKELKVWNKKINLTAIDEEREIIIRHFLDSLTPYMFLKGTKRLLDIGAGGGFPGIPLKIVDPAIHVHLLDSVAKKVVFMKHVIRTLGLKGIEAEAARAEDRDTIGRLRGGFDGVTSRAFAELKAFVEMSLPYLAPGGRIFAIKGPSVTEELAEVEGMKGIRALEVHEIPVPFSDRKTTIVVLTRV
ncbi:MAG: 16S rRNA (guanine(527)-N(7))-methyltransferase RsmG [Deltaproteobacteria bacterium]|nr:16S rRNA (guanine(527)-N(7))-methyltransferase RsmG [Deltaproteobacteria bacterium]